jgi:hypothetical protein
MRPSSARQRRIYPVYAAFLSLAVFSLLGCASPGYSASALEAEPAAMKLIGQLDQALAGTRGELLYLFIHGAGDTQEVWAAELADRTGGIAVDWSLDASRRMKAPARGYSVGFTAGSAAAELYAGRKLPELRLIAHSAGAWLAQGFIDGMLQGIDCADVASAGACPVSLSLVLLDPFSARSILEPFSGARMLGAGLSGSRVTTYYTTRDPVPFTAGNVSRGEIIDLTGLLEETEDPVDAHWQVIEYYTDRLLTER